MTSLTQTAITARRAVRYSIYGLIFLIAGRVVLGSTINLYRKLFPSPPPPPTVLFNKLPKIPFPQNRTDPTKLTYSLQTPDGKLPVFKEENGIEKTQAKVFHMPKNQSTLFSVQDGTNKAQKLGFLGPRQELTETLYKFAHPTLPKTLEFNVVTNIFSLSYDLAQDPTAIDSLPPSPDLAASQVRSYLSTAGLLPLDLTGPTTHKYLKVEAGKLVPALSQSEAEIIEINLFRGAIDNIPSLGPDQNEANVWFLVSGSRLPDKKILSGEFHYFQIDLERLSTYPIKTTEKAWQDLNGGLAFISKSPPEGTVVIRRIYLAYFDPDQSAEFFQPVYVFEGDDFLAFVPAVTDEYYGE